jgi:hypothetical protein
MRAQRDDDRDIRTLVEHASSSWRGPSPDAGRARWAVRAARGHWLSAGLVAAGCGVAVLLAGSLTLVATSKSPDDVVRLVSHVFTTPTPSAPAASPAPSPPLSAPPVPAGAPTPSETARPASRPARTPTPAPARPNGPGYRPTPTPPPQPSPGPSPSPSPTDE